MDRRTTLPHAYQLARRDARPERTRVTLSNGASFGHDVVAICAGPCSVESRTQIELTAKAVASRGANLLRGGAFKPRTSPYAFQGLGEDGLNLLEEGRLHTGLPIITEVMEPGQVERVAETAGRGCGIRLGNHFSFGG